MNILYQLFNRVVLKILKQPYYIIIYVIAYYMFCIYIYRNVKSPCKQINKSVDVLRKQWKDLRQQFIFTSDVI